MNDYPLGHSSLAICKCRKTNVQISKFELRNILASYSHLNQDHAKKTVLLASALTYKTPEQISAPQNGYLKGK